jgi:hypothetical protein
MPYTHKYLKNTKEDRVLEHLFIVGWMLSGFAIAYLILFWLVVSERITIIIN